MKNVRGLAHVEFVDNDGLPRGLVVASGQQELKQLGISKNDRVVDRSESRIDVLRYHDVTPLDNIKMLLVDGLRGGKRIEHFSCAPALFLVFDVNRELARSYLETSAV